MNGYVNTQNAPINITVWCAVSSLGIRVRTSTRRIAEQ